MPSLWTHLVLGSGKPRHPSCVVVLVGYRTRVLCTPCWSFLQQNPRKPAQARNLDLPKIGLPDRLAWCTNAFRSFIHSLPHTDRGPAQTVKGRNIWPHNACICMIQMRNMGQRKKPISHGFVVSTTCLTLLSLPAHWKGVHFMSTCVGITQMLRPSLQGHTSRAQNSDCVIISKLLNAVVTFSNLSNRKKNSTCTILPL